MMVFVVSCARGTYKSAPIGVYVNLESARDLYKLLVAQGYEGVSLMAVTFPNINFKFLKQNGSK